MPAKIILDSANPTSAADLSFTTIIGLQGIGLFLSLGLAAISIASRIAASSLLTFLVEGKSTISPVVLLIHTLSYPRMINGGVNDQFPPNRKRYIIW
jgi:hypothetical protein